MIITNAIIEGLKPCKNRLDNYLKFYKGKDKSRRQFMGLKNITQSDKLWVAFRLMTRDQTRLAAADIAASVLHVYESKYPNDMRPRNAIEAARAGNADAAAYAAAADASAAASADAAAYYASAAAAASDAAYYASAAASAAAADASADASAADAAYFADASASAAASAASAASDRSKQEKLIRTIVLKHWK